MRHVILDTETTSTDAKGGDRIIEIAAVEMVNLRLTGRTFHSYVDPEGREISFDSFKVHGLTKAMLAGAPRYQDIHAGLMEFIGDSIVVIHNAPFDVEFLTLAADASGLKFEADVIDTIEMASKRWPGLPVNLDAVLKRLGFVTDIPGLTAITQGITWDRVITLVDRAVQHTAIIDCIWLAHAYGHLAGAHELEFGEHTIRRAKPWPFAGHQIPVLPLKAKALC